MAGNGNVVLRSVVLSARFNQRGQEIVGDALRRIPGVAQVQVSGEDLSVSYDPSLTSPDQFVNLARQAGFRAIACDPGIS